MRRYSAACILITLVVTSTSLNAQTLRGSRASVDRQHRTAVEQGYSFLKTPREVSNFVANGYLVSVNTGGPLELHNVSYPYARPGVKLFLQRLSNQYRSACGEALTVTSLTRPVDRQPSNASSASVHPTGMAVDLRIPRTGKCRSWLENTLLSLEKTGVLDVTRERNPPHYHVAIFTSAYENYVAHLEGNSSDYIVRNGDSLYEIARSNDTSVAALRALNGLQGNLITPGQTLRMPGTTSAPETTTPAPVSVPVSIEQSQPVLAANTGHEVRKGESLYVIARRNGTTVNAIRALNGLRSDLIQPGQVLKLPATGYASSSAGEAVELEHRVRRGESLWTIARRYGTTVSLLMSENSLANETLHPGQALKVSSDR